MMIGYKISYKPEEEMFAFEVGEKVKIRQEKNIPLSWDWDPESMEKYCGKETRIENRFVENDTRKHYYHLAVDGGKYYWTEDMLEPAIEPERSWWDLLCEEVDRTIGLSDNDDEEPEIHNDPYIPETDWSFFALSAYSFPENSGLGKVIGNFSMDTDGDCVTVSADLEGGRKMLLKIDRD